MPGLFVAYEGNSRRAIEQIEAGWPDFGSHKPLSTIAMKQRRAVAFCSSSAERSTWSLALTAREAEASVKQLALTAAVADLLRPQEADPEYPDAHSFLGIVYFRFLEQASLAKKQLDVCVAINPPVSVASFVGAISKEVDAAIARRE